MPSKVEDGVYRLLRLAANMKCATSFLAIVIFVIILGLFGVYIFSKATIQCPTQMFKCPDEHRCVSLRHLCDGINDCLRGSDELAIYCSDLTNLEQIFGNAVNLTFNYSNSTPSIKLTAGRNASACQKQPRGCLCRDNYAFCHETNWTADFDWHEFADNTSRMVLRKAFSVEVQAWNVRPMKHLVQLQLLALEHNDNYHNFSWEFVENRQQLGKLYLSHNNIKNLSSSDFSRMPKLDWLFLTDNKLTELNTASFARLQNLSLLDLSYNQIVSSHLQFPRMSKLKELYLQGNRLDVIDQGMFSALSSLQFLNLSRNDIQVIHSLAFRFNNRIKELDLSRNQIHKLEPDLLHGLVHLTKLNIESNPLDIIPRQLFHKKPELKSLYLREIEVQNIDLKLFEPLQSLQFAYFKKFEYCRYVPRVPKCWPSTDGSSSMKNLLNGVYLRYSVWVVGGLTLIGNSVVLTNRCFSKAHRSKLVLDVFLNNLAAADAFMGLYFITIAVKDLEYRNAYNAFAYKWSTSFLCTCVGTLAMISREVSLLILTTMSMERYFVITGSYTYQRLTRKLALTAMIMIWSLGIVLGLVPVFTPGLKHSFYGSSGLCFSLHLNEPFAFGWEYSTFVFVVLNTICLVITTTFYGRLFWTIKRTRLSTPVEIGETKMATRLFLMVLIDFFCWVPIIFMKLATLKGYQIQPELHAWIIIIILPMNAAVNPLLYTFSTTRLGVKFVQLFIQVTHLGKYHSYYDGTQFTATTTDDAKWSSVADWKYEDRQTVAVAAPTATATAPISESQ